MNKKIIIPGLFLLIILIFTAALNSTSSKYNNQDDLVKKKAEDLNPISKESAKKVLEAKFGGDISNTEDDFEEEGNYYIIDVNVNLGTLEEHTHTEEELSIEELDITDNSDHIINLGVHKINKYTGELVEN